jgi:hypothetical protein
LPVKVDTCPANKGWGLVAHLTIISDSVKSDNNDDGHCSLSEVQALYCYKEEQKLKVLFLSNAPITVSPTYSSGKSNM